MMAGQTHNCRFCNGFRDHNGKICLGCGTDLVSCKRPKVQKNSRECPGCTHTGPHKSLGMAEFRCLKCGAVFAGQDFTFVDDRPDVNAEKKEQHSGRRNGFR